MSVPGFQTFLRPVLDAYADDQEHRVRDVADRIGTSLGLSPSDMAEKIPSGEPRFLNRIWWAHSYLKQAGLLESPRRGYYRLSALGQATVKQNLPQRIDMKWLERFPAYQEFRDRSRGNATMESPTEGRPESVTEELTPDEQVRRGYQLHRGAIVGELLERIQGASPRLFERLVIDLLVKMGYGGSRADASHVGKSGDGGIDGIIKEDPLGLGSIYVQAKRWAADSTVGRPDIQKFVGAVHGAESAGRGIFITTSKFSDEARRYAAGMKNPVVILIDGSRLAELLIDYGVAIKEVDTVKLVRVDEDYFSEE
jgi:restriction system protein